MQSRQDRAAACATHHLTLGIAQSTNRDKGQMRLCSVTVGVFTEVVVRYLTLHMRFEDGSCLVIQIIS